MTATIRPIRPTDFANLYRFRHQAEFAEVTAHYWPKVQPESPQLPYARVIMQAVLQHAWTRSWAAWNGNKISGLALARRRSVGMTWDVEGLFGSHVQDCADLLERVALKAQEAGARRVFFQSPTQTDAESVARKAAFEHYSTERLFKLTPPFEANRANPFPSRPRLRADEHNLFQLYCVAVPAPVRAAEAMTRDEWSALHRGRNHWKPTLIGDRHQYVWMYGDITTGWMEIVYGSRSQYLEISVHPDFERLLDSMLAYAISQTSVKAPVYASARSYQESLGSSLERAGFVQTAESDLFVRQLAERSLEPALVPAKLVSG